MLSSTSATLGKASWTSDWYFNGSIDEVRIYDRALSAAEVAELYAMESELPDGSVTLDKLAPELRNLLDGNGAIEEALPAGSVIAVKPGDPAPAGYTLFQRNEYNASLTWEEKAPVSVARNANDCVVTLDGKIYLVGGANGSGNFSLAERYDPVTNQWECRPPQVSLQSGQQSQNQRFVGPQPQPFLMQMRQTGPPTQRPPQVSIYIIWHEV